MTKTTYSKQFERVFKRIEALISGGEIRGAALAVASGGDQIIDWHAGETRASIDAKSDTFFNVSSIS